jgi:desulfoferrodoxin-like iron-binding protein
MTKTGQKYKCNICGNEVMVTNEGAGVLVCCGKPMGLAGE